MIYDDATENLSTKSHGGHVFHPLSKLQTLRPLSNLQTDSMLLCVCSVKDQRWCQNVVRTKKWHMSHYMSVSQILFLPHFDVTCDLLRNRGMESICFNAIKKGKNNSDTIYASVLQ